MVKRILQNESLFDGKLEEDLVVIFVVAHDGYLKGAQNIFKLLKDSLQLKVSWYTTSAFLESDTMQRLNVDLAHQEKLFQDADIVFAGLGGRDLNRLIFSLKNFCAAGMAPRVVGYFPGILHHRILESLATRLGCDQVLLNCMRDYYLYNQLSRATIGRDNGILFGSPWITDAPKNEQPKDIDFLFVEQSIVPQEFPERKELVKLLIKLSHQHPDWHIVVALRAKKGNSSSHQLEYCLEEIALELNNVSIEFVFDDIDYLVSRARKVATISSSVAFTSLAWGIPTLFINDLGVKKSWGNDLFERSGYMSSIFKINLVAFEKNRWFEKFVKKPSSESVVELNYLPFYADGNFIPVVRLLSFSMIVLVLKFCLFDSRSPFKDVMDFVRSIRNINNKIYKKCDY